jgi:hypothetical protein
MPDMLVAGTGVPLSTPGSSSKELAGNSQYQITVEPGITITAPRTISRGIRRHKASSYD